MKVLVYEDRDTGRVVHRTFEAGLWVLTCTACDSECAAGLTHEMPDWAATRFFAQGSCCDLTERSGVVVRRGVASGQGGHRA